MQSVRRSSRLTRNNNAANRSTPAPETAGSSSRKNPRKSSQRRIRCTPPPEDSEPEVESLSEENSSEDEEDMQEEILPKETRYENSRSAFQTLNQEKPDLLRPSKRPLSARFMTQGARERYVNLKPRQFIHQQRLSLTDKDLQDVKKVVADAGLLYTVCDSDSFQPSVVREFIANLGDAEPRGDGVAVYVRGSLVEFSPSLINTMYCIPQLEEDSSWVNENLDKVCTLLSGNRIKRGEDMSSKYLTVTNQVLYKLVCSNWIPTMSYTAMNAERLRFVYMLYHRRGFNFGKIVYNQILKMAENTETEKKRRIILPTLIQQVILIQRNIPPDTSDEAESDFPKLVVKDKKAGLASGAESKEPNLEEDIDQAITFLKGIRRRLRSKMFLRGEYGLSPYLMVFVLMCISAGGEYPHQRENEDTKSEDTESG
ncbi:uncharacterized protein LOC106355270 [Brassica napus]|uniref:uncharacterized protein LOC106355270 n=1 Tax=Brassica napus TaxID=3708 RepID=UPI0006AA8451|nr:uncharacterized protein LOC106355270 [Brassica napus]